MTDDLFSSSGVHVARPARSILMSLNPAYYHLMWLDEHWKTHEYRKRFLRETAVTWFVYLTAPVSRLTAVIDLDPAIEADARTCADIAERARPGNGESVHAYFAEADHGFAIPITRVVEYPGIALDEISRRCGGSFHPPMSYVLLSHHPKLSDVCRVLAEQEPIRERTIVAHSPA